MAGEWEMFDTDIYHQAARYFAAKNGNSAKIIFKESVKAVERKLVQNPRTVLRINPAAAEEGLKRIGVSAARRQLAANALRTMGSAALRGLVVGIEVVAVVAAVCVVCYFAYKLIQWLNERGRDKTPHRTTEEWMRSSVEDGIPLSPQPWPIQPGRLG